jgi:hypothetical protein
VSNINPPYRYRPYTDNKEELSEYRTRWLSKLVEGGYDVGTRKRPKGTPAQRKARASEARLILETLGLLPHDYDPSPPLPVVTTTPQGRYRGGRRGRCGHLICLQCDGCKCQNKYLSSGVCSECRAKGLYGHPS